MKNLIVKIALLTLTLSGLIALLIVLTKNKETIKKKIRTKRRPAEDIELDECDVDCTCDCDADADVDECICDDACECAAPATEAEAETEEVACDAPEADAE